MPRSAAYMTALLGDDQAILARLRAGDEAAFMQVVDLYGSGMLQVARRYVKDDDSAQEVVQDTWLAILRSIDAFAGKSSLKSWIFAILIKRAMTYGKRQARVVPFSSLVRTELDVQDSAVAASRFEDASGTWPRHWRDESAPSMEQPDVVLLGRETKECLMLALAELPQGQRAVVEMRDVVGSSLDEIAAALELSDTNVRVLLHRGRSKLRDALERHLRELPA